MKIFHFFFYCYFVMSAKTYPRESDYSYGSAIFGGIYFSIFLALNSMTILLPLDCGKIIKMVVDSWGIVGFFILLLLPFVFVYFSCIHKKKYLKVLEHFNYMDKSFKKRLLVALVLMSHMCISGLLFALSYHYFK